MKKRYWFYVVLISVGIGTCLGSSAGIILNLFNSKSLIIFIIGLILSISGATLCKLT